MFARASLFPLVYFFVRRMRPLVFVVHWHSHGVVSSSFPIPSRLDRTRKGRLHRQKGGSVPFRKE